MKTPFYPEKYEIIEGVKVYTFFVDITPAAPKSVASSVGKFLERAEDALCRVIANAIIARRRAKRCSSGELSF